MEFLVIREEHFLGGLVVHGGGEYFMSQLVQGHVGDPRHALPPCRISRGVQVGDLNMTVSERMAAAIMPASLAEGISPDPDTFPR